VSVTTVMPRKASACRQVGDNKRGVSIPLQENVVPGEQQNHGEVAVGRRRGAQRRVGTVAGMQRYVVTSVHAAAVRGGVGRVRQLGRRGRNNAYRIMPGQAAQELQPVCIALYRCKPKQQNSQNGRKQ